MWMFENVTGHGQGCLTPLVLQARFEFHYLCFFLSLQTSKDAHQNWPFGRPPLLPEEGGGGLSRWQQVCSSVISRSPCPWSHSQNQKALKWTLKSLCVIDGKPTRPHPPLYLPRVLIAVTWRVRVWKVPLVGVFRRGVNLFYYVPLSQAIRPLASELQSCHRKHYHPGYETGCFSLLSFSFIDIILEGCNHSLKEVERGQIK